MNDLNNQESIEKEKQEKKCLENTLSCFIFGIIGIVVPVFIFSLISLHYAKLKKYEKLSKLHNIGEKLGTIGIVVSALSIIAISLINRFF